MTVTENTQSQVYSFLSTFNNNGVGGEMVTTEIASVDVKDLLGGKSISVIQEARGAKNGVIEIPMIDTPDFKIAVKIDLARMTAILSIESDAEQAKNIQDVINADKGAIKARCEQRMKNIVNTLKKMDDAAKSATFNKIFGWIMVAVAVIAAVAASVVTGGVALGPLVGALIALTFQVLNETKVTDKIVKAIADSIQDTFGCDKATARMWATIIWTVVQVAASLAGGFGANAVAGAANAGANAATTILRTLEQAMDALEQGMQSLVKVVSASATTIGLIGSLVGTVTNYEYNMSESVTKEWTALIKMLQARMEEDEEMIEQLTKLLNSAPTDLLELLMSAIESQEDISYHMGGGYN